MNKLLRKDLEKFFEKKIIKGKEFFICSLGKNKSIFSKEEYMSCIKDLEALEV